MSNMICKKCGYSTSTPGEIFCPNCGETLVEQTSPASEEKTGQASQPGSPSAPQRANWDSTPLNWIGGYQSRTKDSIITLCTSGIQIVKQVHVNEDGVAKVRQLVTRIPFTAIADAKLIKKTFNGYDSAFEIVVKSGQSIQFKGRATIPWLKKIKDILENPQLLLTRGIKGTPSQIRGKGVGQIVAGLGFFAFAILLLIVMMLSPSFSLVNFELIAYSVVFIVLFAVIGGCLMSHSRVFFTIAKKAESLQK
ncbi:MAG TPA: hypothetical protein VKM55_12590 [Candidatus Lokiarchaeia archaeon]|nr:hypothetical protein [Candidatus Lokiarchaeia archaeon]